MVTTKTVDALSALFFVVAGAWLLVALLYSLLVLIFLRMQARGQLTSMNSEEFGRLYFCGRRFYIPLGFIFRRYIRYLQRERARSQARSNRHMTCPERRRAMEKLLMLDTPSAATLTRLTDTDDLKVEDVVDLEMAKSMKENNSIATQCPPNSELEDIVDLEVAKSMDENNPISKQDPLCWNDSKVQNVSNLKDNNSMNDDESIFTQSSLCTADILQDVLDRERTEPLSDLESEDDADVEESTNENNSISTPGPVCSKVIETIVAAFSIPTQHSDSKVQEDIVDVEMANSSPSEDGSIATTEGPICSICLSGYEPGDKIFKSPTCSHRFHAECILDWLQRPTTVECPCCRVEMVSEDDVWKTACELRKVDRAEVQKERRQRRKATANNLRQQVQVRVNRSQEQLQLQVSRYQERRRQQKERRRQEQEDQAQCQDQQYQATTDEGHNVRSCNSKNEENGLNDGSTANDDSIVEERDIVSQQQHQKEQRRLEQQEQEQKQQVGNSREDVVRRDADMRERDDRISWDESESDSDFTIGSDYDCNDISESPVIQ